MKYKVFISYSSKDKPFVKWLVEILNNAGISVWYDQEEVRVGDSIQKKIEEGLRASSFLIIVLSRSSLESKWVQYELNSALMYSAQKSGIKILPVLIESVQIPSDISSFRYVDFTTDMQGAIAKLIRTIRQEIRMPNWDIINPKKFEDLVLQLLVREGLDVIIKAGTRDAGFDFTAYYQKILPGNVVIPEKWIIVAKFYKKTKLSVPIIAQIYGVAKVTNAATLLLITSSSLTNAAKEFIAQNIRDLRVVVWDETFLSDLLSNYNDLWNKYFTRVPILKKTPMHIVDAELEMINKLIARLKDCPEGQNGWKEFENVCIEILNYLFVPPLKEPKIQSRTESGIDVRDALYPNRCDHPNWKFVRTDYDAKYILFEFKNYKTGDGGVDIDKSVVNQVRNYLKQTIGRIGFVCSRREPVSSFFETRKQAFIEEKKVILFLSDKQLAEMLMRKYRGEEPSDVILDLVDQFNLGFG
jgi:HJR/Mrr/RecB family endonuclease